MDRSQSSQERDEVTKLWDMLISQIGGNADGDVDLPVRHSTCIHGQHRDI